MTAVADTEIDWFTGGRLPTDDHGDHVAAFIDIPSQRWSEQASRLRELLAQRR